MDDNSTTIDDLREMVRRFVEQRDWQQFHAPKNLVMALAIEAAELMEHFQWMSVDESRCLCSDPKRLHAVGEELADVICYALAVANELGLDVSSTMQAKMERNAEKYPVPEYRGRYEKPTGDADN